MIERKEGICHPSANPRLAIVAWHGLGADAHDLYPIAKNLADHLAPNETYILCPQAPIRPISAFSANLTGWCDIRPEDPQEPSDVAGLMAQLDWVHPWIATSLPKKTVPLIHLGFSQGGAMAATYAAYYPCTGLIMLSSYWPDIEPQPSCPILWQHGTQDNVLPLAWAQRATHKNLNMTLEIYEVAHTVSPPQLPAMERWCAKILKEVT
jgi:predicted esterase